MNRRILLCKRRNDFPTKSFHQPLISYYGGRNFKLIFRQIVCLIDYCLRDASTCFEREILSPNFHGVYLRPQRYGDEGEGTRTQNNQINVDKRFQALCNFSYFRLTTFGRDTKHNIRIMMPSRGKKTFSCGFPIRTNPLRIRTHAKQQPQKFSSRPDVVGQVCADLTRKTH